jgi:hypothetical protein
MFLPYAVEDSIEISAPYIIKICDFVALWSENNIQRELKLFVQNIYRE